MLVSGGYPYSSDDLSARQAQILDKLRGDMTLLMNEEIVPNELKEPNFGEMFLRNLEVTMRGEKLIISITDPRSRSISNAKNAMLLLLVGRVVFCHSVSEAQSDPVCSKRSPRIN